MADSLDEHHKVLMGILLKAISKEEPVTYQSVTVAATAIDEKMEKLLYWRTPLGNALGKLNDEIYEKNKHLPAISSLVVSQTGKNKGLPGSGINGFPYFEKWEELKNNDDRHKLLRDVYQIIFYNANEWVKIYRKLFEDEPPNFDDVENYQDIDEKTYRGIRGRGGESEDHLNLKKYVAKHPELLGLRANAPSREEYPLPSGDRVDVRFRDKHKTILVEVKSHRSSLEDIERGIYQCVKYRAVYCAWQFRQLDVQKLEVDDFVRTVLVTECGLPAKLKGLPRKLNVVHKVIKVNKF